MTKINFFDKPALTTELEANLWQFWSTFGRGPGCTLHDEGDALWFENPIPIMPYNGILKFQVEKNIDQRIDRLVNHYQERRVVFFWVVHPTSSPLDLSDRLRKRGLQEVELMPGMVRSLADLPETPLVPNGIEVHRSSLNSLVESWGVSEVHVATEGTMYTEKTRSPDTGVFIYEAHQGEIMDELFSTPIISLFRPAHPEQFILEMNLLHDRFK